MDHDCQTKSLNSFANSLINEQNIGTYNANQIAYLPVSQSVTGAFNLPQNLKSTNPQRTIHRHRLDYAQVRLYSEVNAKNSYCSSNKTLCDSRSRGFNSSQVNQSLNNYRSAASFHPYERTSHQMPFRQSACFEPAVGGPAERSKKCLSGLPGLLNPDFNACGGNLLSCPLLNLEKSSRGLTSTRSSFQKDGSVSANKSPVSNPGLHKQLPFMNWMQPGAKFQPQMDPVHAKVVSRARSCVPEMQSVIPCDAPYLSLQRQPAVSVVSPAAFPSTVPATLPATYPCSDMSFILVSGVLVDRCIELSGYPKRRFIAMQKIGKGGCGEVYLGQELDLKTNMALPKLVALKFVSKRREFRAELGVLESLKKHYKSSPAASLGAIPSLLIGVNKRRKVLVLQYLSESLAQQFEKCKFKFSLKTVLMLSIRMIELVCKFYYQSGYVHVDVKPSNFCTGQKGVDLQLIDFGYSSLPGAQLPGPTGTPLFMSISIQTAASSSPTLQDDLESIGYVIMFFIAGGRHGLPWGQNNTHQSIALKKGTAFIDLFCASLVHTEYAPMMCALQSYLSMTRNREKPFDPLVTVPRLLYLFAQVLIQCGWVSPAQVHKWSAGTSQEIKHTLSLAGVPSFPLPEHDYDWLQQLLTPPLSCTSSLQA